MLAAGIADLVHSESGPWRVELNQVVAEDRVVQRLNHLLGGSTLVEQLPVPSVDVTIDRDPSVVYTKSTRKRLQRAGARQDRRRRSERLGRAPSATSEITKLLPEIEATHIQRDHLRRNESDLDDGASRQFWQEVIVAHTYTDELEISVLRIDGVLAAYVITLIDGTTYRVLDGRMNTDFDRVLTRPHPRIHGSRTGARGR